MITIKFGRLGHSLKSIRVDDGTTIRHLMKLLDLSARSYSGRFVNGKRVRVTTALHDGDFVVLSFPIIGEATVKRDGKWRVHANDPDDRFPSDFHAHHLDSGEKLDLYTGYLYDPTSKKLLYPLDRKKWYYILRELARRRQGEISAKAKAVLRSSKVN